MANKRENRSKQTKSAGRTWGERGVDIALALIALVGLADATYLTVMHLTGDDAVCGGSGGCSKVLGSVYAHLGPVPTAAFGAVAYFVVFSLAICAAFGYGGVRRFLGLTVGLMFLATLGFLALQAFVLHAYCPFCLLSAAVTFLLTGIVVATWPSR